MSTITKVCAWCRNWFDREHLFGEFLISGGALTFADGTALPLLSGQYFRIIGSLLNDGVHKLGDTHDLLNDETFSGSVWSMAPPPDFVQLVADIAKWETDNAEAISSPYQSESFGGYSYSLKSGASASGGSSGPTWASQFATDLAPWRKI